MTLVSLDEVNALARRVLQDPEAKVLWGGRARPKQWWVTSRGRVVAATSLALMREELQKMEGQKQQETSALLDTNQVAAILGLRRNSIPGLTRRGLKVAAKVAGRGGEHFRFSMKDVEEFRTSHKIRHYPNGKAANKAKPKRRAKSLFAKPLALGGPAKRSGNVPITMMIPRGLRIRLMNFVRDHNVRPLSCKLSDVIESAVERELDRLED